MMLREPWGWVTVLGIALAASAGMAPGQSSARATRPAQAGKTVQPDLGAPPDQAERPDTSTELPAGQKEQVPEPPPPPPETTPAPAVEQKVETEAIVPATLETPPAPIIPASTPEGRRLQEQTATLLALTQKLKAEITKAGTNTLSLVALREADEIQRMSKNLKQEMSRQEAVSPAK